MARPGARVRGCVSAVLAHTLREIDPHYPKVDAGKRKDPDQGTAGSRSAPRPAPDPLPGRDRGCGWPTGSPEESKQAREQRERMAKVRAKVAKA